RRLVVIVHWLAAHAQIVHRLHIGGVRYHLRLRIDGLADKRGRNRRGVADLRLAAAFGRRQGGVVLAQIADREAGQQALTNLLARHLARPFRQGIDDRRHHTGRAAGRRGDDEVTARILLGGGKREGRDQRDRLV